MRTRLSNEPFNEEVIEFWREAGEPLVKFLVEVDHPLSYSYVKKELLKLSTNLSKLDPKYVIDDWGNSLVFHDINWIFKKINGLCNRSAYETLFHGRLEPTGDIHLPWRDTGHAVPPKLLAGSGLINKIYVMRPAEF